MLLSNTICGLRTPFPIKAHLTFDANWGWPIKWPVKNPPWEYPIIPNQSLSKSEFYSNDLFIISIQSWTSAIPAYPFNYSKKLSPYPVLPLKLMNKRAKFYFKKNGLKIENIFLK